MKKLVALLMALVMMLGMATMANAEETYKVGFALQTLEVAVWQRMVNGMEKAAEDLGVEFECMVANSDVAKQIANIENTLMLSDQISKERTFFCYLGANGEFCEDDIDWEKLDCNILHIGYILLLNALDQEDAEYGSKMARLLHSAKQHGIKTSIDVVSEAGDRFCRLVPPALKYTDYCIINEIEAGQTTGIPLRDENNKLIYENIPLALKRMKEMGVSTWAVIHCPEGGFGMDENDRYVRQASLRLPDGFVKGSVGAGDAFCAGVLCSAEHGDRLEDALVLGIASAAASLSQSSATDGMCGKREVLEQYESIRASNGLQQMG